MTDRYDLLSGGDDRTPLAPALGSRRSVGDDGTSGRLVVMARGSVGLGQVTDDAGGVWVGDVWFSRGWDGRHPRVVLDEEFGVGIDRSGVVLVWWIPHAARLLVGGGRDEILGGVLDLVGVRLGAMDVRRRGSRGLVRAGDAWERRVGPLRDPLVERPLVERRTGV